MIKILHLASFHGNIGDVANHYGFWQQFRKYVSNNIYIENAEIREYYKSWNRKKFDKSFVKYANSFDLIIFGGGNFFEMIWDYSSTGTTFDISSENFMNITTPIIFNCVGVDDRNKTANIINIKKFEKFINACIQKKHLFSVRNDGSYEIISNYFNRTIKEYVLKVPDGGFFINTSKKSNINENRENYVAINLACDRINERWPQHNEIGYEKFCINFGKFINTFLEKHNNYNIIFIPHIPQDLKIISNVMKNINDYYTRYNIIVAPYLSSLDKLCLNNIELYKKAQFSIGMRYHANIISIAYNTPTIGIVNLHKHKLLYKDIKMKDRLVETNMNSFYEDLINRTEYTLKNLTELKRENMKLMEKLEYENMIYFKKIKNLLKEREIKL